MRFGRWLLRAFVALVVGILVLVAVGYLLLETGWGRERIRRLAVSEAPKYLYGQLAIGRLSGSLLHGVALDGVDLTQDGRPVFHADRVTVSYNAIGLARGVYALDTIQIDRASLHLVEAGGVWNVARLVRPQPPKPTKRNASFAIRQFTMRDSDVTVEGPGARARHLSAVNAAGSLQVAGSRVGVQIDRATLRDDRSGFVIQSEEDEARARAS